MILLALVFITALLETGILIVQVFTEPQQPTNVVRTARTT